MQITYQQALDFIFSYTDYEKLARFTYDAATLDLSRMERLLALLGNPHRRFRSVHIAGTKGKGSVAAMGEAILRAAGFHTGLYTSPHLHTFRERVRVDGRLLKQEEVVALTEQCRPAIEAVEGITTFEIITALGFLHFAQQGVEWAVLETGLGGRLDATNVVMPDVTAITSLSYDHMELLGHTLALIAGEKAGIIKPGVPLVCAPQAPEAMAVIEETCRQRGAELILVGRDWRWQRTASDLSSQTLDIWEETTGDRPPVRHEHLRIPLLGQHQLLNATMAVALMETLRRQGRAITEEAIHEGLAQTRWPGRLEVLQQHPFVVVDGAHNPDSVARLVAALAEWFPPARMALIFGASVDKDIEAMLKALLPLSDYVITTRSRHPRAADPRRLAEMIAPLLRAGQLLTVSESVAQAVQQALAWAQPADLVCGTGSLFVVGEVREALADRLPPDDWAHEAEPLR
ncbi:MAG: folylpolyglutamate synthase/dihydrofolate synthase family protein [Anaerolineae bacterium]|nr:folylpolyglutamate synthase/dihydrofolate synthase family protein [Anaerolineae bacterium]